MKIKSHLKEKVVLHNIKKLRTSKGYSQDYVAYMLKVKQSSYQKMENGTTKLKLNQLLHLLEIFNTEPEEVFKI